MSDTSVLYTDGRILAAIDPSMYAPSVADHAAWLASRLAAPLELLHVIDHKHAAVEKTNLSGNLSLGGSEALLEELARLDETRGRLAQEHGRLLLEQVAARIHVATGIRPSIRQRHGALVETLLELETGVRIFVMGKRGEHADFTSGHLGVNLERVVRSVHRPVLIATRGFKPIARFMIAYDGSATARKCVEVVCASPLLRGVEAELLLVGEDQAEQRAHMQWAKERMQQAGFAPIARFVAGTPETVITESVRDFGIDLLVMGAYGHSRIRNLIVGSTTTQVLRGSQVPVLLLR